jgi:hypothetical protein
MRRPMLSVVLCVAVGCSQPSPPAAEPTTGESPAATPAAEGGPHQPPAPPVSLSASKSSAADLRKAAEDPRADRAARAAAVFALFANHLKPPCGAAAADEAMAGAKWLDDANVQHVVVLAGLVPVEFGGGGTVYSLHLFPLDEDGGSDWVIYLRLSGSHQFGDLRAFLRGGKGLQGKPELVQFALCYPARSEGTYGLIEQFGPKGLTVVDWN